jgi:protein gp37
MMPTSIGWTNEVWNPTTGCTKVSAGCKNCYAERIAQRFWRNENYRPFTEVRLHPERLEIPLHWRKPRMIFVDSMSDLFHKDIPDQFITDVFWIIKQAEQHTFQVLTKRPERMVKYMRNLEFINRARGETFWPIDNVWLGTSCEDQKAADERILFLLQTLAAVRFVSAEPLLGPIDFKWIKTDTGSHLDGFHTNVFGSLIDNNGPWKIKYPPFGIVDVLKIDWIIVGGESGPNHRPMQLEWLESIVEQCQSAGVPVFVKQDSGLYPGQQGRIPDRLWIHEFPEAK